jgi:hypothetical protein
MLVRLVPSIAGWAENEMSICSRYVAAILVQRLECNMACAAEVRNF